MCGVDPATDATFNEAVKQHFIQGGWLTAEQIAALKQKLNKDESAIVTSVSEADAEANIARKFITDGALHIRTVDGAIYTVQGLEVK